MRQPAVFFGHGSPMIALGGPCADVWREIGEAVDKPKGVVMVSAHWETSGIGVTAQAWPEADVPVVQLSLDRRLDARGHFDLGRTLSALRDEDVVIAGSGDFVHNLRTWKRTGGEAYPWATGFNEAVKSGLIRGDDGALIDRVGLAEYAQMSVPTDEHFLPLLYVAAQRLPGDSISFFNDVIEGGSISMTGVRIG